MSVRLIGEWLDIHQAGSSDARRPEQPVEQFLVGDAERTGQLDQDVGAGNSFAALQLPDRRAVHLGPHSQLFLGEVAEPFATLADPQLADQLDGKAGTGSAVSSGPGSSEAVLVDLIGALSRKEAYAQLTRLNRLQQALLREVKKSPRQPTPPPSRTGEVPRAVARVLADATEPMHISDIRQAVARCLGRPVNPRSVKWALSEGTLLRNPRFKRTALGYYRLASASRPPSE